MTKGVHMPKGAVPVPKQVPGWPSGKLTTPGVHAPKAAHARPDGPKTGLKDVPRSPHSTPGNRDGMKGGAMGAASTGGPRKPAAASSKSLPPRKIESAGSHSERRF